MMGTLCVTFVIYVGLCSIGKTPKISAVKHNQFFGLYMARYLVWVMGPVERLLLGRVTPNQITALSLLMCALCGLAAGLGNLGLACWLFALAGMFDIIDGRLARLMNKQTSSGALFDSVSDRWGELFAFTGFAWFLRDSIWLLAVIGAIGGSMMVSYTRARAEGLKIELSGGLMQRAERIFLVCVGTMLAAWFSTSPDSVDSVVPVLGGTMALVAATSSATAISRWLLAYRLLAKRDADAPPAQEPIEEEPEPVQVRAPEIFAPVPKALRESAELPL